MLHPLTTEQLRMLIDAMRDKSKPPKFTDDPRVNYAIDCIVSDDDEEPYDEKLNKEEIEVAKTEGLD